MSICLRARKREFLSRNFDICEYSESLSKYNFDIAVKLMQILGTSKYVKTVKLGEKL